ncbi:unnamed protein product, partial [Iphiclides podalirius]
MGYNAKEVVRVFACSTQLSYNLSEARYKLLAKPIKNAILRSRSEFNVLKDTFSSISDVVTPIKNEVEGTEELNEIIKQRNIVEEIDPGLGEGYLYLMRIEKKLTENLKYVKLQYKVTYERELYDVQDAKETGERVMHEFEQRGKSMRYAAKVVNVCLALMALRVVVAAQRYHDNYLTTITYDNLYITSYFKRTDKRRRLKNKYTLLPLKKVLPEVCVGNKADLKISMPL